MDVSSDLFRLSDGPTNVDYYPIKTRRPRFWELDFLRGICVLLMIFDHFMFSAGYAFDQLKKHYGVQIWSGLTDFAKHYWNMPLRANVRFVVITIFFLLCGISCTLTRSNVLRALKACAFAIIITIVTALVSRVASMQITILFGVIHMLGVSMLLYSLFLLPIFFLRPLIRRLADRKRQAARFVHHALRYLPAFLGLVALILYFGLGWGYFGHVTTSTGTEQLDILSNVTVNGSDSLKSFLSLFVYINDDYYVFKSADYFPILPYAAVVLLGSAIGEAYYRRANKYHRFDFSITLPINFVGSHAMKFYLAHQAVFGILFYLVARSVVTV